jgi:hypothetical protein
VLSVWLNHSEIIEMPDCKANLSGLENDIPPGQKGDVVTTSNLPMGYDGTDPSVSAASEAKDAMGPRESLPTLVTRRKLNIFRLFIVGT